jgi:hypothetical protein
MKLKKKLVLFRFAKKKNLMVPYLQTGWSKDCGGLLEMKKQAHEED